MTRAAYSPEVARILDMIAEDAASIMAKNLGVSTTDVKPDLAAALREAFRLTLPYVLAYAEPSAKGPRI